jgi:hypothetical protein
MSTTSKPMLSQTHLVFRELQSHIRTILAELPVGAPAELVGGLTAAHTKLSDYYYLFDATPYYIWAARRRDLVVLLHLADLFQFWALESDTRL